MLNHLINCPFQSQETRDAALAHKAGYSDANTTRSPRSMTGRVCPRQQETPLLSIPRMGSFENDHRASGSNIPQQYRSQPNRYTPYPPSIPPSYTEPNSPANAESSGRESPTMGSSIHPSDSASQSSFYHSSRHPSQSRQSSQLGWKNSGRIVSDTSHGLRIEGEESFQPWSPVHRKKYEKCLLRLTASAGLVLSWLENPEWHALRESFIPGAPYISRKVLTQRILPTIAAECRETAKANVKGQEATLQSDGWTGINNHHLVAYMITVNKKVGSYQRSIIH